jgi:hypothetical protein
MHVNMQFLETSEVQCCNASLPLMCMCLNNFFNIIKKLNELTRKRVFFLRILANILTANFFLLNLTHISQFQHREHIAAGGVRDRLEKRDAIKMKLVPSAWSQTHTALTLSVLRQLSENYIYSLSGFSYQQFSKYFDITRERVQVESNNMTTVCAMVDNFAWRVGNWHSRKSTKKD